MVIIEKMIWRCEKMSKVFVFFADGFEEIEGLTVVDILRRADVTV